MANSGDDSLQAKIEEIRQMFLQRMQDEWMARLVDLRAKLAADWSPANLEDAVFLSHTMAGSGATFGYKAVSDIARKIEIAARGIMRDKATDSPELRGEILAGLESLEGVSRTALKDLRS